MGGALHLRGVARAKVCGAQVEFAAQRLDAPLQLSSGVIRDLTQATATVDVETPNAPGRRVQGRGSIYLSDLWAWPDPAIAHEVRDAHLRQVCRAIAEVLPALCADEWLHPTEIGLRLHEWVSTHAGFAENPPRLARAMAASPFDAAIHDAVGIALERSAFRLYDEPAPIPTADPYFPPQGACRAIAQTIQVPRRELPAWWIVNQSDVLEGPLAEPFARAVRRGGYRCFKLKITGSDLQADVERTSATFRAVRNLGVDAPRLTVDSNEANPDAASVVEYLSRLQATDRDAYAALEYLEQPTARDIRRASFDWREATRRKPVFLDEGLTDLDALQLAKDQGWSGAALKTCKGHSMLLVAAAWARRHNLLLALQDLTNPGIALIHGALAGAHLPTVNGAELNSPQFTPDANRPFLPRISGLFEPREGRHTITFGIPPGLGSGLGSALA